MSYKEPRSCPQCGFSTLNRSSFSTHRKSCSYNTSKQAQHDLLRLQQQYDGMRELLAVKDIQFRSIEEQLQQQQQQLLAKDAQLAAALERIASLEGMLGQQLLEVKEELRQTKRRKDRYPSCCPARHFPGRAGGTGVRAGGAPAHCVSAAR